jgi:hypothetical protein
MVMEYNQASGVRRSGQKTGKFIKAEVRTGVQRSGSSMTTKSGAKPVKVKGLKLKK